MSSTPAVRSSEGFKSWLSLQSAALVVHPTGPRPDYLTKSSLLLAYKLHLLSPEHFLMPRWQDEWMGYDFLFKGKGMEIKRRDSTFGINPAEKAAVKSEVESAGGWAAPLLPPAAASGPGPAFEPSILFLGTGSSQPSTHRNVSSTLLTLTVSDSVLLDCGEGTLGQILSVLDEEEVGGGGPRQPPRRTSTSGNIAPLPPVPNAHAAVKHPPSSQVGKVKAVWISHPHADHCMGLREFLHRRAAAALDTVTVVCPRGVGSWIEGEECSVRYCDEFVFDGNG